jgi:hypothetical protein
VGGASRGDYFQDKVRLGTGREGSLGCVRRGYVQDERYIARSTWMCGAIVSVLHTAKKNRRGTRLPHPSHRDAPPTGMGFYFGNDAQ